jgi:hypothetical protein
MFSGAELSPSRLYQQLRTIKKGKEQLTEDVYWWHSVSMEPTGTNEKIQNHRRSSAEKVQIGPGVWGPKQVTWDRIQGDAMVLLELEYEEALGRYVCTEFRASRAPDAQEAKGYVTSEILRAYTLATWVLNALNLGEPVIWQLDNPDKIEPWGLTPPKGLSKEGPTERALRWTAHLYRCALAVGLNPAVQIEKRLKVSHSTAARWIRLAREKKYLGPSEGPGRVAA